MENLKNKTYGLLRWSEQYTKTDMVYLAKGGFWLTFGQISSSISVFILAVVFANLLTKDTYGTYKYVISISGMITVLTLKGMEPAVLHAISRGFEGVLLPALRTKIRWGILATLISLILSFYYYLNGNNTLAVSFVIISGFLPIIDSFGIYNIFLQGKKLFRLSAIYTSLSQIISTAILIAGVLLTQNLFIILTLYFASWTILRFVFLLVTIKKSPPNNRYDQKTIPYGKYTSLINILDSIVSSVDGLLIFHYLGAVNLAIYSFAIAPISQIKSVTGHISTLAIPKLSNRPSQEIENSLIKRILLLFAIGISITILYIFAAPYIYQIFFPKYTDAVPFSQLFAVTMALSLPQTIFGAATSSKLTMIPPKMLYLWNLPGIIFIVFALLFVIKLGIIGVIIGRLISLISGFIIQIIIWEKIKKIEKENFI